MLSVSEPTKTTKDPSFLVKTRIPIFEINLFLSVAPTMVAGFAQLPVRYFPEKDSLDPETSTSFGSSCAEKRTHSMALVLISKCIESEAIAHEIRHLEGSVFNLIGEAPLPNDTEVASYINGWIAKWVSRQLRKKDLIPK